MVLAAPDQVKDVIILNERFVMEPSSQDIKFTISVIENDERNEAKDQQSGLKA